MNERIRQAVLNRIDDAQGALRGPLVSQVASALCVPISAVESEIEEMSEDMQIIIERSSGMTQEGELLLDHLEGADE